MFVSVPSICFRTRAFRVLFFAIFWVDNSGVEAPESEVGKF